MQETYLRMISFAWSYAALCAVASGAVASAPAERRCDVKTPVTARRRYRIASVSGLAVAAALALTGAAAGSALAAGGGTSAGASTAVTGATSVTGSTATAGGTAAAGGAAAAPRIVPEPVAMTSGAGHFALTAGTRISAGAGAAAVARDLAGYLRPATGYRLPVGAGAGGPGLITLRLSRAAAVPGDPDHEGYRLSVTSRGVTLTAVSAHGLYNGIQTIRQLLPPWISSATVRPGPWTMPAVQIVDHPRYTYRGVMLDIARHYESPAAAERYIAQAAAYKINTFHLHLSDDQGFRVVIKDFPKLTTIGGQGSVGTGGRTMDPGGYWTQAQYQAVVADARAHFMTLIPEVDSPGHNNAIIMSEWNDTTNPRLNGHPQDINCSTNHPPVWDYTGDVGYSALCPDSQNTWTIMGAIIHQLDALTPGPYHDLGGDEVPSNVLSQSQYAEFINTEAKIIQAEGKIVMGWADLAGPGTDIKTPAVAEYWNPASGSDPDTATGTEAVAKGMQVVMAPANHTYLDQKYVSGKAGNVPPTLGQDWACAQGCDVDQFYNWDPGRYVTGVTDRNVIGVEGALWTETIVNLSQADYMVYPRLPALAEVAWSPKVDRTLGSPAYRDFLVRLAAQGARWQAAGQNFYPSTEVPWRLDLIPRTRLAARGGSFRGAVATLAAPGRAARSIRAIISWGDGTTSAATVSGPAATSTSVNGLYSVSGRHRYAHPGVYHATVTASAPGTAAVTVSVTVRPGW
jgi:hexosaminidase